MKNKSAANKARKSGKQPQLLKIASVLLAIVLILSIASKSASALSINGEGQGISGASSTSSVSYAIKSTQYVLGFRFSLVDKNGQAEGVTMNVYNSTQVNSWIKSDTYTGRFTYPSDKVGILENLDYWGWRWSVLAESKGPLVERGLAA